MLRYAARMLHAETLGANEYDKRPCETGHSKADDECGNHIHQTFPLDLKQDNECQGDEDEEREERNTCVFVTHWYRLT